MNSIQFVDAARNVKKKFVSWIAIAVVTMIGAGCYMGGFFYADSAKESAYEFWNTVNYHDLQIIPTRGFTDQDLEKLSDCEGVQNAEGCFLFSDSLLETPDETVDVTLISETKHVDLPQCTEGRLPEAEGECVMK